MVNSTRDDRIKSRISCNHIDHCDVSLRQNGVSPNKTCADSILPKGHEKFTEGNIYFYQFKVFCIVFRINRCRTAKNGKSWFKPQVQSPFVCLMKPSQSSGPRPPVFHLCSQSRQRA